MDLKRQIAVIAPEQLINAFSVLIDSVSDLSLMASAVSLEKLVPLVGAKKPEVILIYLVREIGSDSNKLSYEEISRSKKNWPDSMCITIAKNTYQMSRAKESGADLALMDGVKAERLLAALEGKLT